MLPKGTESRVRDKIMTNESFIRASFDTDYLINLCINGQKFLKRSQFMKMEKKSCLQKPLERKKNRIFSNNLEYIDYVNTVEKLKED